VGEALANALMKASTKAKRRLTLSLCGLGFLDETEVGTIPGARDEPLDPEPVKVVASVRVADRDYTPEPVEQGPQLAEMPEDDGPEMISKEQLKLVWVLARKAYDDEADTALREWLPRIAPQAKDGNGRPSTKLLSKEEATRMIDQLQLRVDEKEKALAAEVDEMDQFPDGEPGLPEPLLHDEIARKVADQKGRRPTRKPRPGVDDTEI